MQEMRSEKSETGNKDFECSHPISHFSHNILRPNNWILPWEMGNEIQTRILVTEVLPSVADWQLNVIIPVLKRQQNETQKL